MPSAFDFTSAPFDRLRPAELERVRAAVDLEVFRTGTTLLRAGDLPDFYYLVVKGLVEERRAGEIATVHGPGDGFDGLILAHKACRHDFVVTEEAICYLLPIEDFLELAANNAAFGLFFIEDLSQRLERLDRQGASSGAAAIAIRVGEAELHEPVRVSPSLTLHEAALEMDAKGQRALLVEADDKKSGIVTGLDLTRAAVRDRRPLDTAIGDIATFDLVTVERDDPLIEAAYIMARHGVRHLLVKDRGAIVGVLDAARVLGSLASQSAALGPLIDRAGSVAELAEISDRITGLVRHLHDSGTKIGFAMRLSSELHRRLMARLFELLAPEGLAEHACLLAMGSEGRGEYLLKTDQDNGLVLEEGWAGPDLQPFLERFTEAMVEVGFPLCPGGVMIRNPEWSRTEAAWRATIDGWLTDAGEAALMNAAILYDAAPVAGSADLLERTRGHLIARAAATPAFCARFARAIDLFEAPGGFLSGLFADRAEIDVKKRLIFPIVHGVRALALERGMTETGTVDRLRRLQEVAVLDEELARTLADSFHFVTGLRLTARLEKMRLHQPLDNTVRLGEVGKLERDLMKETHSAVRRLREIVRHHFHLAVLG